MRAVALKQRIADMAELVGLRGFAALVLLVSLFGAGVVAVVFGVTTGIRSLYVAVGAGVVLAGTATVDRDLSFVTGATPVRLAKLNVTLGLFGVSTAFLMSRTASLLFFIPALLVLVGVVVRGESRPKLAAVTVTLSYGLFSVSKLVGTRYYYGSGDVLGHTLAVRQLLHEGPGAIAYTAYASFPGLHATAAGLHLVSGLPVHAAYTIAGTTVMTVVVAAVYCLYRLQFTDGQTAVLAALLYATFEQTLFFSTYTFPQTLAFGFAILVFYLGLSLNKNSRLTKYLLAGLFAVASAVTHHFTALLLFPAAGIIAVGQLIGGGLSKTTLGESRASQVVAGWVGVVTTYWLVVDDWLFNAVGYTLGQNFLSTSNTTSGGGAALNDTATAPPLDSGGSVDPDSIETTLEVYAYGTTGRPDTVERALISLLEPTLLYQVALVALVVLSVYALSRFEYSVSFPSVLLLGIGSTALIIKTPTQIWSMARLQMAWVVFFSGFAAVGVRWVLTSQRETAMRVVLVLILGVATVSGGLGGADDVSAVGLTDDRTRAVALGDDYNQYTRLATFADQRDANVSAPWISGEALHSFGADANSPQFGEHVVVSEGRLLLVESDWSERMFKSEYASGIGLARVYFSDESLNRLQSDQSRVYTSGDVALLYDDDRVHRVTPPANATAGGQVERKEFSARPSGYV